MVNLSRPLLSLLPFPFNCRFLRPLVHHGHQPLHDLTTDSSKFFLVSLSICFIINQSSKFLSTTMLPLFAATQSWLHSPTPHHNRKHQTSEYDQASRKHFHFITTLINLYTPGLAPTRIPLLPSMQIPPPSTGSPFRTIQKLPAKSMLLMSFWRESENGLDSFLRFFLAEDGRISLIRWT